MNRTLYGDYSDNCCAYCKHHRCHMTYKQVKAKECLKKQCYYLVKIETHEVWRQRALRRQKAKEHKRALWSIFDQAAQPETMPVHEVAG